MKKFFALLGCIVVMAFVSCNENQALPNGYIEITQEVSTSDNISRTNIPLYAPG